MELFSDDFCCRLIVKHFVTFLILLYFKLLLALIFTCLVLHTQRRQGYDKHMKVIFLKFGKKFGNNHFTFDGIGGSVSC